MKKENNLDINYVYKYENQNIDINKLRPNKSYDYLIENRNQDLNKLLKSKKKIKKFLLNRKCPSCDSNKKKIVCKKDSLNIVECKDCSLVFVSPTFDYNHYINLYKKNDYQKIVKKLGEKSHNYRRKRFGSERVKILKKFLKKKENCNVLEIGCSTGFFLEEANKFGWKTLGLELNPSAVEFAKTRGLNVENIDFLNANFKKKFDVICAFDVLEHLIDPKKIVKKAYKYLKKNGLIFVYVPNWQSATRLLLGEKNSHFIWPTHHLTYFTPNTLKNFFERLGFKLLFWETKGLDLIDIDWYLSHIKDNRSKFYKNNLEKFQFIINSAGYGKNLRMIFKK